MATRVTVAPLAATVVVFLAGVDPANLAPSPTYGDLLVLLDARLGAILPPDARACLAGSHDVVVAR